MSQDNKNENAYYKKFLEQMHDAVFILDQDLNIIDCNALVQKWYGYTHDEIVGKNLSDIRAAATRGDINKQLQRVLEENGGKWETLHLRKNGSIFQVEVSCTPIEIDGEKRFYHVVRDITERKAVMNALRASEERYKSIIDLSPDAIYIHIDRKIVLINQAGCKMFGASDPKEILGKPIWDFYTEDRHGIVRARNQLMEQTNQAAPLVEHTMLRLDGSKFNVEAIARPITYDGRTAIYVILHDISERKRTNLFLEMQYSVSKILVDYGSLNENSIKVIKAICNNLHIEAGRVWSTDKKDNLLHCIASWPDQINYQLGRDPNKSYAATVMSAAEPRCFEELGDKTFQQAICAPIINGNEVIGMIELLANKTQVREQKLLDALFAIAGQLGAFIKRKLIEKELIYNVKHDPVTGLANRILFDETLSFAINIAKNNEYHIALILFNINAFSAINNAYGREGGDQLLKMVAQRIIDFCGNKDNVVNFGVDEFGLYTNRAMNEEEILDFIKALKEVIYKPYTLRDQQVIISVSTGVSVCPENGDTVAELMRNASIALSQAREIGRNSVQFCTNEMSVRSQRRIFVENELHSALNKQEFELYYQPIVDASSRFVCGFEALLRWRHNGSLISPGDFIPIAEKSQLIVPIGEWIIRTACEQAKAWYISSGREVSVSVNISPVQFKHSNIVETIIKILNETATDPKLLKVEITESAIMDDIQNSIATLNKIKELGVRIAVDDFGSGYSSLNYLRHLPVDYLKIDQSFIRNMTNNPNDAAIVKTIVALANNLNYKIIAEGVETIAQLDYLNSMGDFEIQGYYFGQPMRVDDATEFLKLGKIV